MYLLPPIYVLKKGNGQKFHYSTKGQNSIQLKNVVIFKD